MQDAPDLSPQLWETMMENPPPRDDALCRDVYDQAKWVADGMPLVPVTEDWLWPLFWERRHVDQLCLMVERMQGITPTRARETRDIFVKEHDWCEAEIWETQHNLRDYHLFKVEETALRDGNLRIFRVPPTARDRMKGRTVVAKFVFRSETESLAALARRYHVR